MKRPVFCSFLTLIAITAISVAQPLLVQQPTLSEDRIVFVYAGDLWSVPRGGGDAIRLTTAPGLETEPFFSPDSRHLCFFADDKLKKVFIDGGPAQTLCDAADLRDGTWGDDGTIILTADSGLLRISCKNSDCNPSLRACSFKLVSEKGAKGQGSKSP